jgi:NADPH2:quinone reductase
VVLDRRSADLESAILEETEGRGIDRIVEVDLPRNIGLDERILAERGAIVSFGGASAPSVPVTQSGRRARNMGLHFIFVYLLDERTFAATAIGINEMAETGQLKHRIGGTFALTDLARAHRFAETNSGSGHVIVEIG